jgi:triphosphoribosyl-dephospho-CoA synthase
MTLLLARVAGAARPDCRAIGRAAIRALYREIALFPKPGLVSPVDTGAHSDMDMCTFFRSLSALRAYFPAIAAAGAGGAGFPQLQQLGLAAERSMLAATKGINTHRGAIFTLGLIAAAVGRLEASAGRTTPEAVTAVIRECWAGAILAAARTAPPSHGATVSRCYGARGAREEAADGFPLLTQVFVPTLRETLAATGDVDASLVQTLFVIMARLDDTNIWHRGGAEGFRFARGSAEAFLASGGVFAVDWHQRAVAIHRAFTARRLSPGGSADMLAATWFLHERTETRG